MALYLLSSKGILLLMIKQYLRFWLLEVNLSDSLRFSPLFLGVSGKQYSFEELDLGLVS